MGNHVWALFVKGMTCSEIDHKLGLYDGVAKGYIIMRWRMM